MSRVTELVRGGIRIGTQSLSYAEWKLDEGEHV